MQRSQHTEFMGKLTAQTKLQQAVLSCQLARKFCTLAPLRSASLPAFRIVNKTRIVVVVMLSVSVATVSPITRSGGPVTRLYFCLPW